MPNAPTITHPFGELLSHFRQRRPGLSQRHLAELAGFDQALVARMAQGKKDLTGPSGRARVVRLIETLADQELLSSLDEANALLLSADLAPLFERQPDEARLLTRLSAISAAHRVRRTNLLAPLTSFVGRGQELAELRSLLGQARLLTLTGAGGCGKTRLAQRLAGDALLQYADGVWCAELAALRDADQVAEAITGVFGLSGGRPAIEQAADFLRDRRTLILLDNCEHLIEAVAGVVMRLLGECAQLTIVATSRQSLDVDGELTWRVPPMQADEAAQLFVERAKLARPQHRLREDDVHVAQICTRLEGMPLALELAAARLRTMSAADIVSQIDRRFELLSVGRRGAVPRHQTLRALIDWSYERLSPPEQLVFRRLGVFVEGWDLEQASAVVGEDASATLTQLVAKSLVLSDERHGRQRFSMLETLREYALERLDAHGEREPARLAHARTYADLAEQLSWFDDDAFLTRYEREYANMCAVLVWSFDEGGDVVLGCCVAGYLIALWDVVSAHLADGRRWIAKAYPRLTDLVPVTPRAFICLRHDIVYPAPDLHERIAQERITLALTDQIDNPWSQMITRCRLAMSLLLADQADPAAFDMLHQALRIIQESSAGQNESVALSYFGEAYQLSGQYELAEQAFVQALKIAQEVNALTGIIHVGCDLAEASLIPSKRYAEALERLEAAVAAARRCGDLARQSRALRAMAECHRAQGALDRARELATEALDLIRERLDPQDVCLVQAALARIEMDRGEPGQANALINSALRAVRQDPRSLPTAYAPLFELKADLAAAKQDLSGYARLRGALDACMAGERHYRLPNYTIGFGTVSDVDPAIFEDEHTVAAYAEGRALPLARAIDYALGGE